MLRRSRQVQTKVHGFTGLRLRILGNRPMVAVIVLAVASPRAVHHHDPEIQLAGTADRVAVPKDLHPVEVNDVAIHRLGPCGARRERHAECHEDRDQPQMIKRMACVLRGASPARRHVLARPYDSGDRVCCVRCRRVPRAELVRHSPSPPSIYLLRPRSGWGGASQAVTQSQAFTSLARSPPRRGARAQGSARPSTSKASRTSAFFRICSTIWTPSAPTPADSDRRPRRSSVCGSAPTTTSAGRSR